MDLNPAELGDNLYQAYITLAELFENNTGKLFQIFFKEYTKGNRERLDKIIETFEVAAKIAKENKRRILKTIFETCAKMLKLMKSTQKIMRMNPNKELKEVHELFIRKFGEVVSIKVSHYYFLKKPEEVLDAVERLNKVLKKLIKYVVYEVKYTLNNAKNNNLMEFNELVGTCQHLLNMCANLNSDLLNLIRSNKLRLKLIYHKLNKLLVETCGILNGLLEFMQNAQRFFESCS